MTTVSIAVRNDLRSSDEALAGNLCQDFPLLKEDVIDMEGYIKDIDHVKEEKRKFKDYLRYYDGNTIDPLDNSPLIVKVSAIVQLFDMLSKGPCDANIRSVKIILGLSEDKIVFFFCPVTMNRTSDPAVPATIEYEINEEDPTVYKYNEASCVFDPIIKDDLKVYTDSYADRIRLLRYPVSVNFSGLNLSGRGWKQDTLAVIFSFQEIFTFYHNIYPCEEDNNYDQNFYFYSGVSNYHGSAPIQNRRKHTIFIGAEPIEDFTLNSPGKALIINSAANLAHLCPPSCSPVYKINNKYSCD